jgi:Methyltransferase domain
MSLKQSIKRHPKLKKAAQILRGDQVLALNYPVALKPRYNGDPHPRLNELISRRREEYAELLRSFLPYQDQLTSLRHVQWVNGYFPALDSISLYCLLAKSNPKTYLEIGSGNSTKFARESITNNQLGTKLISIDPNPRAEIDAICDRVVRTPVEDLPLSIFEDLVSGDILFVDNSHRALANSDVTVFFMDILPNLPPGVLVHLHDICLPWDYAEEQAEDAYSEQYLLATALLMGSTLRTRLPNLFVTRTPELISILSPLFDSIGNVQREGCSFWLSVERAGI